MKSRVLACGTEFSNAEGAAGPKLFGAAARETVAVPKTEGDVPQRRGAALRSHKRAFQMS